MNTNTLNLLKQNNKKSQAVRAYGEVLHRNQEEIPLDFTPRGHSGDLDPELFKTLNKESFK